MQKRAKKSHTALQVINAPLVTTTNDENSAANFNEVSIVKDPAAAAGAAVAITTEAAPENEGNEALVRAQMLLEREMRAYSARSFIIPSCSGWFNLDQIHEIEM